MAEPPLILVVDDEAHIRHVVSLKLKNAGYEVLTAEDGEEGLSLALEHMPALVLTDYQMPFLSGLEMATRLCEHEPTSTTPVLMLTARGFNIPDEALEKTNIIAVLAKPFSPRDVLARVNELLGNRPAGAEVKEVP